VVTGAITSALDPRAATGKQIVFERSLQWALKTLRTGLTIERMAEAKES
jgi:hypothetical protein